MRMQRLGFVVLLSAITAVGTARSQQAESKATRSNDPNVANIDLFEGMQSEQIHVKVIPLGAHKANVIIENKTNEPLSIRLPAAFAAVPVLGQIGGGQAFGPGGNLGGGQAGGLFGGGGANQGGQGGGQGLGGGFGGNQQGGQFGGGQFGGGGFGGGQQFGGGQFGRGGLGGGQFRVDVDRPAKLQVTTVCLEHGKPTPNPRMKYTLVPIEQFNADPRIAELCKMLSQGEVSQNVAQAAAWNMANGLSWKQLAKLNRRESQYTGNEKFFTSAELQDAARITGFCRAAAEERVTYTCYSGASPSSEESNASRHKD